MFLTFLHWKEDAVKNHTKFPTQFSLSEQPVPICLYQAIGAHAQWRQVPPSGQWAISLPKDFTLAWLGQPSTQLISWVLTVLSPLFTCYVWNEMQRLLDDWCQPNQNISKCPRSRIWNNSENLSCTPLKKLYLLDTLSSRATSVLCHRCFISWITLQVFERFSHFMEEYIHKSYEQGEFIYLVLKRKIAT